MSEHPDSDELALLAMDADVADSVREHIATCRECQSDVALLTSLLAADGPGDRAGISPDETTEPTTTPVDAWADGNDTSDDDHRLTSEEPDDQVEPAAPNTTTSGRDINYLALVVVVLIVLASIAMAVVVLR